MAKVRSWAGLDVHARSVLAVTMDAATGEIRRQRLTAETANVVEFLAGLPGPTRVAYEAGPTGYGLARALDSAGIGCVVAAPGKIERPAQDKVKTDARDAERVLRLLMIDALVAVRVPTVEEEAIRDLVRAREDVRGDLMRWRQRLSKLLLRHGIVYEDTGSTWTQKHRAWIRAQDLGGGAQVTLLDHLGANRHARAAPRSTREEHRRARPRLPVRGHRRPAQMLARDRHALSRRLGGGARRPHPVRPAWEADELPRARPVGEQLRRDPPPRTDHQDRQ